ncbi:MAG: hypothetical protein IJT56_03265 [Clostridia bacterium]|nr:hypothetical protein [Clostridia bacterium]
MNYTDRCTDASSEPEMQTQTNESETGLIASDLFTERFDYTEWRRLLIDEINDFDDLDRFRAVYGEPVFKGNPKSVI